MKKKTLGLLGVCLLASAGLGMCAGVSIYHSFDNQIAVVYAEGEQAAETIEEGSTDPTQDEIQKLLDEVSAKYKEIRDTQIFGTTLGTLLGAVIGVVVSLVPSLLNRSNIKKAIGEVSLARRIVDDNKDFAEKLQKDYSITNENYNKAISAMGVLSKSLEETEHKLNEVCEKNEQITAENKEIKELLMTIFSQSAVLTSLGISEETFKKYLQKPSK